MDRGDQAAPGQIIRLPSVVSARRVTHPVAHPVVSPVQQPVVPVRAQVEHAHLPPHHLSVPVGTLAPARFRPDCALLHIRRSARSCFASGAAQIVRLVLLVRFSRRVGLLRLLIGNTIVFRVLWEVPCPRPTR